MKTLIRAALTLLLVPIACTSNAPEAPQQKVISEGEIPALPLDHPPVEMPPEAPPVRGAQRLSIEQLRGSFAEAMGPRPDGGSFVWMSGSRPALDVFSRALGEADFINVVEDDLDASPLYLKFVDDAARSVCGSAIASDIAETNPQLRSLTRFTNFGETVESAPGNIDSNLRDLLLRFHGTRLSPDDPGLEPSRTLFTEIFTAARAAGRSQNSATQDAWRAVCVALLTAPEFHLY